MTLDSYNLARMLTPQADADSLKARYGTVVNTFSDGTANVMLDGSTTAQRLTNWSNATAGSRCMVVMKGTDWIVLSASGSGGGGTIEVADFIVDRYTTDEWEVTKWASGKMEQMGHIAGTYSATIVFGSLYYNNKTVAFPEPFIEPPKDILTSIKSGAGLWTSNPCDPTTTGVTIRVISSQSEAAANRVVEVYAVGRWSATPVEPPYNIAYNPTVELTAVPVPVGGIYETLDPRDPADLWTGTAWEALGAGRTTIGAGEGYEAGSIGGNNTLTVEQMPSHRHQGYSRNHWVVATSSSNPDVAGNQNSVLDSNAVQSTGGNQPHQHPYVVVYRWRRLPNIGAVEELNLAEITAELQSMRAIIQAYKPFTYTTTKQDTGRTTDDGYIIWGQLFKGTITAAVNSDPEQTLISGLPSNARMLKLWGSWAFENSGMSNSMGIGEVWGNNYKSGAIRRLSGTIGFFTYSSQVRTNAPYEAFVDFTDGTLRT